MALTTANPNRLMRKVTPRTGPPVQNSGGIGVTSSAPLANRPISMPGTRTGTQGRPLTNLPPLASGPTAMNPTIAGSGRPLPMPQPTGALPPGAVASQAGALAQTPTPIGGGNQVVPNQPGVAGPGLSEGSAGPGGGMRGGRVTPSPALPGGELLPPGQAGKFTSMAAPMGPTGAAPQIPGSTSGPFQSQATPQIPGNTAGPFQSQAGGLTGGPTPAAPIGGGGRGGGGVAGGPALKNLPNTMYGPGGGTSDTAGSLGQTLRDYIQNAMGGVTTKAFIDRAKNQLGSATEGQRAQNVNRINEDAIRRGLFRSGIPSEQTVAAGSAAQGAFSSGLANILSSAEQQDIAARESAAGTAGNLLGMNRQYDAATQARIEAARARAAANAPKTFTYIDPDTGQSYEMDESWF